MSIVRCKDDLIPSQSGLRWHLLLLLLLLLGRRRLHSIRTHTWAAHWRSHPRMLLLYRRSEPGPWWLLVLMLGWETGIRELRWWTHMRWSATVIHLTIGWYGRIDSRGWSIGKQAVNTSRWDDLDKMTRFNVMDLDEGRFECDNIRVMKC